MSTLSPPAPISRADFVRRRRQLMKLAGEDAILILPAATERIRNRDSHYPYRQDSDFWYLSGCNEPEAVLVLVPGRKHGEMLLFCRERDAEREAWDGPRLGPEGAVDALGFDDAYAISDIDDILPGLIEGRRRVFYHFGREVEFDLKLIGWVNRVRALVKQGAESPHEFQELGHLLHDLRLFKSKAEIRLMQHSANIAALAHRRAMQACKPGMHEFEIEAELQYVFRKHGAVASYEPIVGGGGNACVLHYRNNDAPLANGELLLIDAGAEFQGYASDITRTFPINGSYSREQRALHDLVEAAQQAAMAQVLPGNAWIAPHDAAVEVLTEGMLRLGLLKGSLKDALVKESYRRFYMHKTGHWLGLDVHDVGDYRVGGEYRLLEPGMVLTIEPGIYIAPGSKGVAHKWQGIGIRIEDDLLVTEQGHKVLSEHAPRSADDIEAWMSAS